MRLFLLSLVLFYSCSSFAKVGYVNLAEAFKKSKRGQRVEAQLKKKTDQAKAHFKSIELKLAKEEEAFKKEAPLLSDQARAQKIQSLQQKIIDFQRDAKNKDMELQNLQTKLMNPVFEQLKKVIGEVAKKESYTAVENIGNDILWVSPQLDLTKKVYQKFNKKYK